MGFFNLFNSDSKLLSVQIDFANEQQAFVRASLESSDSSKLSIYLLELFYLYYGKQLYNLAATPPVHSGLEEDQIPYYLLSRVEAAVNAILKDDTFCATNILGSEETLLETPPGIVKKTFNGELWQKKSGHFYPQTPGSANAHGGEIHYAPLSVVMFLQFVVNTVEQPLLGVLFFTTKLLTNVYSERKLFESPQGILQATTFAKQGGLTMLKDAV